MQLSISQPHVDSNCSGDSMYSSLPQQFRWLFSFQRENTEEGHWCKN